MDIPEALLYTKSIMVLIKSIFGYGSTPTIGLSLRMVPLTKEFCTPITSDGP